MDDFLKIFRGGSYTINPKLIIRHPTLGEICDYGEQKYFGLVRAVCSTPSDRKVEIWESMHVFWDTVDEYNLFLSMFRALKNVDASILFGDLDFQTLKLAQAGIDLKSPEVTLINKDRVVVDRAIHKLLTDYIRKIHRLKKNTDVGYDTYTKKVMIEDEKEEMQRQRQKPFDSLLVPLISALTNCPEFKYRWDDIWQLPIGVFMDSIERIQKHKNYGFIMQGIYAGCIDTKKLNKKELQWMGELK